MCLFSRKGKRHMEVEADEKIKMLSCVGCSFVIRGRSRGAMLVKQSIRY